MRGQLEKCQKHFILLLLRQPLPANAQSTRPHEHWILRFSLGSEYIQGIFLVEENVCTDRGAHVAAENEPKKKILALILPSEKSQHK